MARRKKRQPKARAAPPPAALERGYQRDLLALVRELTRQIQARLVSELDAIAKAAGVRADARWDADAWITRVRAIIRRLRDEAVSDAGELGLRLGQKHAALVSTSNRRAVRRQLESALGVDIFAEAPGLDRIAAEFVTNNVALVQSIPEELLDQVETLTLDAFKAGRRAETVAELIQQRFGVTESRARLIGRDQIAKLNGKLTELRQTNLGIDEYIWRSSRDERVRSRHAELDGTRQRWAAPPVVDTKRGRREHPGGDFQCRCTAEPVIPAELAERPRRAVRRRKGQPEIGTSPGPTPTAIRAPQQPVRATAKRPRKKVGLRRRRRA